MTSSGPSATEPGSEIDLLVEIVDVLESHGVSAWDYQLYDTVDVEALDRLRRSSQSDLEVRVTIEGLPIVVTENGVRLSDAGSE